MAVCVFFPLASSLHHTVASLHTPLYAIPASVPPLIRRAACLSSIISFNTSQALFPYKFSVSRLSAHSTNLRNGTSQRCRAALEALVFDCDGVILESEDLHRRAYNAAFANFHVRSPHSQSVVDWDTEFYDELQNRIGGGKPKMRWYFNQHGWPLSTIFPNSPQNDEEKALLIDTLQDWKTEKYKDIIASGAVSPRPGVLQLMDDARAMGIKLAVCSAATKSSVVFCLNNLLGEKFSQLDCFIAGDDVEKKKPDPTIYNVAAKKLGVNANNCLVVEDSVIGLQAAIGAGMNCIISFTSSTANQDFKGAKAVFPDLGNVSIQDLLKLVEGAPAAL